MDDDQQDDEQLQANSPEPLRQESPVPEYNNDERMMRLNLENSFHSDMNPPSQYTTMAKRMMSRLRQITMQLDDSFRYINSILRCMTDL